MKEAFSQLDDNKKADYEIGENIVGPESIMSLSNAPEAQ